jgi:hypothetical protein
LPETQIRCAFDFHAAAIVSTGIGDASSSTGSYFAFLLLPLEAHDPHLPIKSVAYKNGRVKKEILELKNELCTMMRDNRFDCQFVATHEDFGMSASHPAKFDLH